MPRWNNWKKLMLTIVILIVLLANPITRQIILFILPLGSGIDDLIFFVLLFFAGVMLLLRFTPVKDKLNKVAHWFMK